MRMFRWFHWAMLIVILMAATLAGLMTGIGNYPNRVFDRTAQDYLAKQGEYGKWQHLRKLVDADFRSVVRPNRDTIYSSAFVDLKRNGVELSIPAIASYFSFAVYDENTNIVGYVSSRTHGLNNTHTVQIVGPNKPENLQVGHVINSPTNRVWILGRFYVSDDADYPRLHQIQDALSLKSLNNP